MFEYVRRFDVGFSRKSTRLGKFMLKFGMFEVQNFQVRPNTSSVGHV